MEKIDKSKWGDGPWMSEPDYEKWTDAATGSLLGIPAVVVHGNTLTQEEYSRWYTPFHILHGWNSRLAAKHEKESVPELFAEAIASPDVIQFELFEVAI